LSLYDWAAKAYAAPGVAPLCLTLQDEHGQSVCLLLWALWAGEAGRMADADLAARAAALAHEVEANVLKPLRATRRTLKASLTSADDGPREALRARIRGEELAAERGLLDQLEAMTPEARGAPNARIALAAAVAAWGEPAPPDLLSALAAAFSVAAEFAKLPAAMSFSDEPPLANDEAIQARIAELRQAHQDLDDAVQALAGKPVPDQLQIARLKRQKLALRDQITRLEDRLTPDIIA